MEVELGRLLLQLGKLVLVLGHLLQAGLDAEREGISTRVTNDHDLDQIFGLDCRQQSIPIDF